LAAMTPEDEDGGVRGLAAMTPEDEDGAVRGLATQIRCYILDFARSKLVYSLT